MALNLSGILGAVGGVIGGANLGQYTDVARLLGGGLNIASAITAPTPQYAAAPVYGPVYTPQAPVPTAPPVYPTSAPAVRIGAAAMAGIVSKEGLKILLTKVATYLGRKGITLERVVSLVRSWGRFLGPTAVATALGLEVGELAILLSAHSARKRRRMNPANVHALRRAIRRQKAFSRLASRTHAIRPRRSASRCGTCKRSPCRC